MGIRGLLLTLMLSGAAVLIQIATARAEEPIKIGVLTPLSGTYAGIGQQVRWGSRAGDEGGQ
jgi:branched-chain amino acid transport system substrate-binding protein